MAVKKNSHSTFLKKLIIFSRRNYFIPLFILAILFVALVAGYKLFFSTPTYIYAKIKVGQGYWWASTAKPSIWYVNSLKKGDRQYDFLGQPTAEILRVTHYPLGNGGYDIYITVRLKVGYNKRTKEYIFNRSVASIGSPIEIQFPASFITGTIISIAKQPFKERYVEKIVYLVSPGGYSKDSPYKYDNIVVGEKFFNGEEDVFEILDKRLEKNIWAVQNNLNAQLYEREVDITQNIIVKAKIKLKEKGDGLYFGEEYKLNVNSGMPLATPNYSFNSFSLVGIENENKSLTQN